MFFVSPETLKFIHWLLNESIYRYPIALVYIGVLYVGLTAVWNKTQIYLASLPDPVRSTPSPSRLDIYPSATEQEQKEIEAVLSQFQEDQVVTPREIQTAVHDSTNGLEIDHSKGEWWDQQVRPWLESHPDIKQLDDTGRRWRFNPPKNHDSIASEDD